MTELSSLISEITKKINSEIKFPVPAQIIEHNVQKMTAKIELLVFGESGQKIAPLINVPVGCINAGGYIIRPKYSKGDIVQVLFNGRDIDNLLIDGKPTDLNSNRKNSYDDAVIVCSLKTINSEDFPNNDGLFIGDIKNNVSINIIQKNIEIKAENVNINCSGVFSINGESLTVE